VLDDGKSPLTHLLPAGFGADCFSDSATVLACRLVVEQSSNRKTKRHPDLEQKKEKAKDKITYLK
jgi:hypothetical protein